MAIANNGFFGGLPRRFAEPWRAWMARFNLSRSAISRERMWSVGMCQGDGMRRGWWVSRGRGFRIDDQTAVVRAYKALHPDMTAGRAEGCTIVINERIYFGDD